MKKILFVFLSIFAFVSVHAEITWSISDDGTLTISGTNMPNYRYGSSSPWSSQREKIRKVEIKEGVTNIGNRAFLDCLYLTSITIPNSVASIGFEAFYNCSNLTSVTIPNSVTSIGVEAFYNCSNLISINIPNSITTISKSAFAHCSGLTSITIPNSVTSIDNKAFECCYSLESIYVEIGNANYDNRGCCNAIIETGTNTLIAGCKNTIIPNSVTSIGTSAFSGCKGLTSIIIPNSVTSIGNGAFEGCSGLTSITIPNSVTSIENYAFAGCPGLTSITIPNSVASIEDYTFWDCYGLISITIPNSVTKIGDYAFNSCYSLTSITIPNSVTKIGVCAFEQCSGLISISVEKDNTNYDSRSNCEAIIETATNTLIAGCKNTIIPNSVTSIGDGAFEGCSGLTSVTIPNSVTKIGGRAFYWSDLLSITNLSITPQNIESNSFSRYGTLHVLPGCKDAYQKAKYWKNFTIVEDAVDPFATIELADGMTYNEATTQENKEISYTRTFNNTSWQSLYIPFSMTYEDWKDDFEVAYINGIRQMDTDDNGAIDETIMDVVKIKSGSLIPNTPYLIKAKTIGNKTITVNDATLYKTESNSVDCSTTIAKYTFTGTYSTIPAATLVANNYYAMGGGKLIMTDGTSDLKPFRWYLNVESRSPMYNVSSGAKAITINVVGEEEATGISQMPSDREDSSAIYDLNGRRMSQKNMKSGLYIKNGKKIIIK